MINLETLFKNHFLLARISYDNLKKFSEDHLARISVNNADGRLKEIVSLTGAAHTAYFGAISNKDVAAAVKEGMTVAVDKSIKAFKALVRRKAGAVLDAFGDDSREYHEFFPQGVNEYTKAGKAGIETLMRRIVTAGLTHEKALGGDFANAFSNIYNEYQNIREAQLGKKGDVSDLGDIRDEARAALTTQLTANIHYIGYTYPGNAEKCLTYFDQSILHDSNDAGDSEAPAPKP